MTGIRAKSPCSVSPCNRITGGGGRGGGGNLLYRGKRLCDVVTLGTFCDRDHSFINRSGVGYFFHGRRGTEPDPPPTHTQSKYKKF